MRKILMTLMGLEIGGAETHVAELAIELKKRGYDVSIASNGGVYETVLKEHDIKHYAMPLHNKNPINVIRSYYALKRIIKAEKFDIVHAHARIPAFICGLLSKRLKFKFITTAHWVFRAGFPFNIMTDWGPRTIAVSDDIKQYLIDNYGMVPDKIDVTINGIDTEKFSAKASGEEIMREFGLNADKTKIVYVSRMDTDRSAVAFMLIDALVAMKNPDLQAVIVGGGNDLERLKAHATKANKVLGDGSIIVTGARTDINKCVAVADLFVGVSRAALEAMSAEKPTIIAGNEGYIGIMSPETLDAAFETNFCCRGSQPSSAELLARDIKAVLDSDMREMGEYNRKIILDHYSVSAMTDDYISAYNKLYARPVLVSGYYGYRNMGDDCLLSAIIHNLGKQDVPVDVTVLSLNPKETTKNYGVSSIYRFGIWRIIQEMRRGGLLINGGGSILQDVTSTKSLLYYLFIIRLAKRMGLKVMIYANGIGPVQSAKNRRRTRNVLKNVDVITLREEGSLNELRSMSVDCSKVCVTADPAFALKACEDERISEIFEENGIGEEKGYFIVCARPWSGNCLDFEAILAEVCDYVNEEYDLTPMFITMQPYKDLPIAQRIIREVACKGVLLPSDYDAGEIMGVISKAKFVIGMRLHTLIYAGAQGVPFIGLSYDPKIDAIVETLEQKLTHKVSELKIEDMQRDVDYIIANSDEIRGKLLEKEEEMKERTMIDAKLAADLVE